MMMSCIPTTSNKIGEEAQYYLLIWSIESTTILFTFHAALFDLCKRYLLNVVEKLDAICFSKMITTLLRHYELLNERIHECHHHQNEEAICQRSHGIRKEEPPSPPSSIAPAETIPGDGGTSDLADDDIGADNIDMDAVNKYVKEKFMVTLKAIEMNFSTR